MSNAFTSWTQDDVRRHNERVQNVKNLAAAKSLRGQAADTSRGGDAKPLPAGKSGNAKSIYGTKTKAGNPRKAAKLESNSSDAPLGAEEIQRPISQRFLVRVTSRRRRLLDQDNLCEKYVVDLCRYAGIIPSDAPGETAIEVRQQKSKAEKILIEVFGL